MGSFLLLHGGQHGAWCWEFVRSTLEERGHEVLAPELPGRDGSWATFEDLYGGARAALEDAGADPIVVAHSMGGATAALVASRHPDRVGGVVFAAAVVPDPGRSILTDAYGELGGRLRAGLASLPPSRPLARRFFGTGLSREQTDWILSRLNRERNRDWMKPFPQYSLDRVPCSYVLTSRDRLLSPRIQLRYAGRLPGGRTTVILGGHSIYLEHAARLATIAESMKPGR